MPVAVQLDFPGTATSDYDAVMRALRLDGQLPLGCLLHAASAGPDGLVVWDVWETAEAFERFAIARLQPEAQRLGLPRPDVRVLEIHNLLMDQAPRRRGGVGGLAPPQASLAS